MALRPAAPTERDFSLWLYGPDKEPFVYHEGFLPADRLQYLRIGPIGSPPQMIPIPRDPTDSVARRAWHAQRMGEVALVQRRVGEGSFQYIAQKKERRL